MVSPNVWSQHAQFKMFSAKGDIIIVRPKHDLWTGTNHTVLIISGVAGRLAPAPTHRLKLLNHICDCNQSLAPREQLILKIRAEKWWRTVKISGI